jgi:hypothetical protein
MNSKIKWIITILMLSILIISSLLSGCTQVVQQTPQGPNSTSSPILSSQPAVSSGTTSLPAITAETSGERAPYISKAELNISKPPSLGETVDLSYSLYYNTMLKTPVNKVWLKFELYDPGIYYPLGRGQREKDRNLNALTKVSPDSGVYFFYNQAAREQPDSTVSAVSVIVAGNAQWEGNIRDSGYPVKLNAQVCFPDEGNWIINALSQAEDGTVYADTELRLTVNKDSGTIGWPKDYSSGQRIGFTTPDSPIGVFVKMEPAPLKGEALPVIVTLQSTEDLNQAEAFLSIYRMDGYRMVPVPLNEVISENTGSWKGSLKKGNPINFPCSLKFLQEADYFVNFMTRPYPESRERSMIALPIHIDEEKSIYSWPVSHSNPALEQIIQEQKES